MLIRKITNLINKEHSHPEQINIFNGSVSRHKTLFFTVFFTLFLFINTQLTHAVENQFKLNGFWLHQYKKSIPNTLGKSFKAGEKENSTWEVFMLPDSNNYMVFEFDKTKIHWIKAMQITGKEPQEIPFFGLRLGDDKSKVLKILGKPDEIKQIISPKVSLYKYRSKNFTVEIDDNDKLYSIRIDAPSDLFNKLPANVFWDDFKESVFKKDFKKFSEFARPDMEIYKDNKILDINKSFEKFFSNAKGEFYSAIFSKNKSLYQELKLIIPTQELRFVEGFGSGWVFKFQDGKILEEISFFPYAGKYRVYEIKFRTGNAAFIKGRNVAVKKPAFNYSIYNEIVFDQLINKTPKSVFGKTQYNKNKKPRAHLEEDKYDKKLKKYTPYISLDIIGDPKKYLIKATIEALPMKIGLGLGKKNNRYEHILRGVTKQDIPVTHAIEVRSEKGKKLLLLVQDSLVPSMFNELKKGDKISLYCFHYYNDNEGPGLLVSEFKN